MLNDDNNFIVPKINTFMYVNDIFHSFEKKMEKKICDVMLGSTSSHQFEFFKAHLISLSRNLSLLFVHRVM